MPGYNSVFLEQWLLLDRKNIQTTSGNKDPSQIAKDTHVLMCTTMFREVCFVTLRHRSRALIGGFTSE